MPALASLWSNRRDHIRAALKLARREIVPLVLLAFTAICLLTFAELVDDVMENDTHAFDLAVLDALRGAGPDDPIGPEWLEDAARDFTSFGGTMVLVMMAALSCLYLTLTQRAGSALYLALCLTGGSLLSNGVKELIGRTRPDAIYQAAPVFTASFPSGHALLSAVFYLTLGALLSRVQERKRVKLFLLLTGLFLTLLVGATRIYLGVHWTTDVLAGWLLGAAWAAVCWCGLLLIQRRTKAPRPTQGEPP